MKELQGYYCTKMKGDRSMIERFKRSAKYDKGWIDENKMDPTPYG